MANQNASKDENFVNTLTAVLNTDGTTVTRVQVNPVNHALKISDGTTGTNHGPSYALRDGNDVPTLLAASSVDGRTPVAVYCDSSGNLLIKST